MAIYTATLSAQNTNVYVCTINKPRAFPYWFANACIRGTFGTGTVSLGISFDNGTTITPLHMDGTNTDATTTAASCLNLRCAGEPNGLTVVPKLYASIGTATNPSISITVIDNT